MESERQLVNGGVMRNFLGRPVQMFLKVDRLTPGGQSVRQIMKIHEIQQCN